MSGFEEVTSAVLSTSSEPQFTNVLCRVSCWGGTVLNWFEELKRLVPTD